MNKKAFLKAAVGDHSLAFVLPEPKTFPINIPINPLRVRKASAIEYGQIAGRILFDSGFDRIAPGAFNLDSLKDIKYRDQDGSIDPNVKIIDVKQIEGGCEVTFNLTGER